MAATVYNEKCVTFRRATVVEGHINSDTEIWSWSINRQHDLMVILFVLAS